MKADLITIELKRVDKHNDPPSLSAKQKCLAERGDEFIDKQNPLSPRCGLRRTRRRKMKKMALVFSFILFGCVACENKKVVKAFNSDSFGYVSCGEGGSCLLNFVCVNDSICCPNSLPQGCGGQCFSADCECVEDKEFSFCLPDNMEYCGRGVSCQKNECYLADDTEEYYCVSEDQGYCGDGVVCDLNADEICQQGEGRFYCAPKGYLYCFGKDRLCEESEICTENSCCPKVQPLECGQTCCYPGENCVDADKSVCLPKGGQYCNGAVCVAGEDCAPNNLSDCIPEIADICANGQVCSSGSVCSIGEEGDCCPQGQPQRCGKICCPANFTCMETGFGKKCVYPGAEPCGDGECDPGEFCAIEIFGICAEDGSDPCDDGHICEPGTYCAGPTCCSFINANQSCGMLCCPSDWDCINNGEACIPSDAEYLGNGKYCDVGTKFNTKNGNCDPIGWEPCGTGAACKPGTTCSEEGDNKQCCPTDQKTLCGDKCCFFGFKCFHDGAKNVCIPPGGDYCWGTNVNEWCSPGKICGEKGKNCIPNGAMECENGDFCAVSEKCTESKPSCCPWAAPIPCVSKCCSLNSTCEEISGEKICLSTSFEICPDTIMGDTLCFKDNSFCAPDGACIDNKWKGLEYNYCNGGEACGIDQSCGALCSGICCDGIDLDDECKGKITECLPNYGCSETKTTVSCCGKQDSAFATECIGKACKNLQCAPSGTGNYACCTYDKATPVSCINGCVPFGQICYDIPTTDMGTLEPNESGMIPEQIPYEVFKQDWVDYLVELGMMAGLVGVGVFNGFEFVPAGLSPNIGPDGVYQIELVSPPCSEDNNWDKPKKGDKVLIIEDIWIIDPLEGKDMPHGPYGRIYVNAHSLDTFPALDQIDPSWLQKTIGNKGYNERLLPGPHCSELPPWKYCICWAKFFWCFYEKCYDMPGVKGPRNEWAAYEFLKYTSGKAAVYVWGENEEAIYISITEGDETSDDDVGGIVKISKNDTLDICGREYDFYQYEPNVANPKKTNKRALRIRFRTITCTGKAGDPC